MPTVEVPDDVASDGPDEDADATAPPAPGAPAVGRATGRVTSGSGPDAPGRIDWSGRGATAGSDDRDDAGPGDDIGSGSGTRRLAVLAGIVSFAYIGWVVVDLVVLAASGTAYTTMHAALDALGVRVVLAGIWLALLYHGLDGLRLVLADFVPRLRRRDRVLRALVAFVLFTVWIPTALVILWPSVRRWFAA